MDKGFFHPSRARLSEVPSAVKVLAVTKQRSVAEIVAMVQRHEGLLRHGERRGAHGLPLLSFGENRPEDIQARLSEICAALPQFDLEFHFLGKLQSRKIPLVVEAFDVVQSVENLDQITRLNRAASVRTTPLPCFLEVNLTQIPNRSGTSFTQLPALYAAAKQAPHLKIVGLMGMAEAGAPVQVLQKEFSALSDFKKILGLEECSMGMSDDYSTALACEATWLRLGRVLFEIDSLSN